MFYRAFLRTGCLVTADGTADDLITIGKSVQGSILDALRDGIKSPEELRPQLHLDEEQFIITFSSTSEYESSSSSDGNLDAAPARVALRPSWDTEDEDDDTTDYSEEEEEEPPCDIELYVPDEAELMEQARVSIPTEDELQMRDFNFGRRVAREHAPAHLVEEFKTVELPVPVSGDTRRRSTRKKRVRTNC
jgi:hypothetical protein